MTITIEQKYHGAAFKELIDELANIENPIYYSITPTNESRSGYIIEVIPKNQPNTQPLKFGLFIKHSSKRRSPWRYSFQYVHQVEMDLLKDECDDMFLLEAAAWTGETFFWVTTNRRRNIDLTFCSYAFFRKSLMSTTL